MNELLKLTIRWKTFCPIFSDADAADPARCKFIVSHSPQRVMNKKTWSSSEIFFICLAGMNYNSKGADVTSAKVGWTMLWQSSGPGHVNTLIEPRRTLPYKEQYWPAQCSSSCKAITTSTFLSKVPTYVCWLESYLKAVAACNMGHWPVSFLISFISFVQLRNLYMGSGCVAQLVERLLPIPEIRGSNPVIGKNLFILNICLLSTVYWNDKNKEKEAGNGPLKK